MPIGRMEFTIKTSNSEEFMKFIKQDNLNIDFTKIYRFEENDYRCIKIDINEYMQIEATFYKVYYGDERDD